MEAHQQAMNKAKIALLSTPDSAFFSTLCFSLKHTWDDRIPTAGTNGKDVKWNPGFFMKLNASEQVFLLLHETLHAAYLHALRRGEKDARLWNIACDHVINLQLIERGFKMPTGDLAGYADKKYYGMSADEVYKLLKQEQDANPEAPKPKAMDDLLEPGEGTPGDVSSAQEIEQEMSDILVRAAIQSKMSGDKAGTIPGDIQIFLDKLLNPKLPWERILSKYLQKYSKSDYSWRKPSRRFFPKHYLPAMHSECLMDLVVAVDTSGSVSDAEFQRFTTEIAGIMKYMKPEKLTLIHFDTEIKSVDVLRSAQDLYRVKFSGRGGTDIHPLLDWIDENKPQAVLVFTDGEFPNYRNKCKSDVIWLIHNNSGYTAPFGKVITYET